MELILKYASKIPEYLRDKWTFEMQNFAEYKTFLKHPDWKIHTKSKDGTRKLFTRVSSKPLFCVKSISYFREDPLVVNMSIADTKIKQKFDDTFDYGTAIYPRLALDCSM